MKRGVPRARPRPSLILPEKWQKAAHSASPTPDLTLLNTTGGLELGYTGPQTVLLTPLPIASLRCSTTQRQENQADASPKRIKLRSGVSTALVQRQATDYRSRTVQRGLSESASPRFRNRRLSDSAGRRLNSAAPVSAVALLATWATEKGLRRAVRPDGNSVLPDRQLLA